MPILAKIVVEENISYDLKQKTLRAINNLINQDSSALVKEKDLV